MKSIESFWSEELDVLVNDIEEILQSKEFQVEIQKYKDRHIKEDPILPVGAPATAAASGIVGDDIPMMEAQECKKMLKYLRKYLTTATEYER